MGWLGAMAGAGQGLQQFSSIMGENRKLQWEQQQSDIAYQRQLNLEQLRKQNDMDLAKTQRQWKMEDYDIAQKKEEETYQRRRGEEETDYQRRRAEAVQDRRIGFQEQLDQMRAQAEVANTLSLEQKHLVMAHTKKQLEEIGVGPEVIKMHMFSILSPDLFKALSTSTGKGGLSAEDAVRAAGEATDMMKMGMERWNEMSKGEQETAKKNLNIGKDEDAATVFAETWTYDRMKSNPVWGRILSGAGGGGSTLSNIFGSERSDEGSTSNRVPMTFDSLSDENKKDILDFAKSGESDPNKIAFIKQKLGGEENYNRIMEGANAAIGLDKQPMRNPENKGSSRSLGDSFNNLKLSVAGTSDTKFREWMKKNYPSENLSKLTDKMEKYYLNKYRAEAL